MGFFQRRKYVKLAKSGELGPVLNALKSNDVQIRLDVIYAIGESRNKAATETLINLLSDANLNIRVNAAEALGKIGGPTAITPLINSLKNDSLKSFMALPKTVVPTEKSGQYEAGKGEYMALVAAAAKALEQIGTDSVDKLIEALTDGSARVRGVAIITLKNIGSKKCINALNVIAENKSENLIIRAAAVFAIDKITNDSNPKFASFVTSEMASPLEAYMALDVMKETSRGDYSSFEKVEQGFTANYLIDSIKKHM